ncbi:hypothetical protein Tco_0327824, partial [Tanacetum coccineum]
SLPSSAGLWETLSNSTRETQVRARLMLVLVLSMSVPCGCHVWPRGDTWLTHVRWGPPADMTTDVAAMSVEAWRLANHRPTRVRGQSEVAGVRTRVIRERAAVMHLIRGF